MMFKKTLISCAGVAALGTLAAGTAVAGVPIPTIDGKIFADLTDITQENNGTDTANSGTGADVKRFYLIVNESFDSMWSAKLETDATYNSGQQVDVYMKNAWLQMTADPAFWVRLGESDMPWIPFDEGLYGHRYIENTLIDRLHFGNSADWGLHIGGDVDGKLLSYQLSAVNGAGYKNPTRSKDLDLEGRVSLQPLSGVTLAIGGYTGKLGQDKDDQFLTVAGASVPQTYRTATRLDALAAYTAYGLRVGIEYFSASNWTNGLTGGSDVPELASSGKANPSDKADGTSVFASYDFTPMWGVFGRWDQAKLSQDLAPGLKDQYFDVGLEAHPIKNVDVALVYKHEKMDGGPAADSFATTNGSAFSEADGTYNEIGIWTQVAF
jgi:hypothetical protein